MRAVILERNKLVGRKVARAFLAVGAAVEVVEEPDQVAAVITDTDVLCADSFDGELVADLVRSRPPLRGVLWTAEPLQRTVKFLPGIDHVLARRDFDSPPAAWELLMVARGGAPPFAGYLDWGFSELTCEVGSSHERDVVLQRIGELVAALHVPNRVVEMVGELAYELVMNAMYDAPVDARGRAIYAANRKAQITLAAHERPTVRAGTDGSRFVLQVSDPFGRLERRHIVDGLARGFAGGEQDRSHGGAGLGLFMCHNACSALCFDITRGTRTEVTAVLDLDLNLRELRTLAKSLHVWSAG